MKLILFLFLELSYSIVTQCKLPPNNNFKIVPLNKVNDKKLKGINDYENIRIKSYYFKMENIQNNKTINFDLLLQSCEENIDYFKSVLKVVQKLGKLYVDKDIFSKLDIDVPISHCIIVYFSIL